MSENLQLALIVLGIGIVILVVVRVVMTWLLNRVIRRLETRPDIDALRLKTQVLLIRRLVMLLIGVIVAWNVLDVFPNTRVIAQALLASSAVIALLVGLAVQTPLSNLGAGLLLAFTQPVRLGDRATVTGHTGVVEEITSIHTVLRTDDERRIFIPNETMISHPIDNRTIVDPRRSVAVRIPARVDAPPAEVRAAVESASHAALPDASEVTVRCAEVNDAVMWFEVEALVEPTISVKRAAGAVREHALVAIGERGWLPVAG